MSGRLCGITSVLAACCEFICKQSVDQLAYTVAALARHGDGCDSLDLVERIAHSYRQATYLQEVEIVLRIPTPIVSSVRISSSLNAASPVAFDTPCGRTMTASLFRMTCQSSASS